MKKYYQYTKKEFLKNSKIDILVEKDDETIFEILANEMIRTIVQNNRINNSSVIVCPVGPIGQYKYLADKINSQKISLSKVWFINMDEYLDDKKEWIVQEHRLSFRGFMNNNFYNKIDKQLIMPESQRIFPDPHNTNEIPNLIKKLGKIDLVVGGIGINGHIAFNEPDDTMSNEAYLKQRTRVLEISPETKTANAIGDLDGAIEEMPHYCITIGFNEIFSAKKIILGCFRSWHKAVVRRAACDAPSSEFPVTLLQHHDNIHLYISEFVAGMGE